MRYKLSRYNYCIQREHTIYVCNFFSGAFIQLNSMEYEKIFCEKSFEYDNELCSELVSNGILIPFYANEKQQIDKKRAKYILENNTSSFRILPTWRCNARCYYCYEYNRNIDMDKETAQQVIEYIVSKSANKYVNVQWFGGEPLLNIEIIDYITDQLTQRLGNRFSSSMITNASLVDENIAEKMKEKWNLQSVQVTLDGTKEEYERRKNYSFIGSFDKVMENIDIMCSKGIKIFIRINYDNNNYRDILKLIDILSQKYSNINNVFVYAHPIFESIKCSFTGIATVDIWRQINDKLISSGFLNNKKVFDLSLRSGKCSACQSESGYVIDPEGKIFKCTMATNNDKECIGTVWSGEENIVSLDRWCDIGLKHECEECIFLPLCQGGCKAGELGYSSEWCFMSNDKMKIILDKKIEDL